MAKHDFSSAESNNIAKALGVKLELQQITAANRIPYLVTNKLDIVIAAMGASPERALQIAFTSPCAALSISVFGPDSIAVTKPSELKDQSIGVARGTTQDLELTKAAPKANIVRFEGASAFRTGFQKLLADADRRIFEVVVCEGIDRLGRRLADTADLQDDRRKVEELERVLEGPDRAEAMDLIRSMIGRVEVRPRGDGPGLDAVLFGDLAAILAACSGAQKAGHPGPGEAPGCHVSVVAGTRNQRCLRLLRSRVPRLSATKFAFTNSTEETRRLFRS